MNITMYKFLNFLNIVKSVSKMKSIRKLINPKAPNAQEPVKDEGNEEDIPQYKYFTCPSIVDIKVIDSSETEEGTIHNNRLIIE